MLKTGSFISNLVLNIFGYYHRFYDLDIFTKIVPELGPNSRAFYISKKRLVS